MRHISPKTLQFSSSRLRTLLNTLRVTSLDEYSSIVTIAEFATTISTYLKGFSIIIEPYPDDSVKFDPLLTLSCLDSSIGIKPVFERFHNVVLTSGTMSPISIYPKILDFKPFISKSIPITLSRNSI